MRIVKIEALPVHFRFAREFVTSKKGVRGADGVKVLVKIHADNGLVGIGEGSPSPAWNGETAEATVAAVRSLARDLLGLSPLEIEHLHRVMRRVLPVGYTAAKCAIDIACFDVAGKHLQMPVYQLLGGARRERLDVLRGLGIGAPQDVAQAAREAAQAGYRLIKVKVGVDARLDVERVQAVRAAVPPETLVSADANEGYTLGDALNVCRALEPCNLLCLEQPLVRWDLSGHARLRSATRVPIMLDESAMSPSQMLAAIQQGAADYIFLKLDNCGGIHPARQVAAVARAGNVVPIAGGSAHTGIGAAALAHLAVALDLTLPAGVNGPQQLAPDCLFIKEGGLRYEMGGSVLRMPEGPGLGVHLDEAAVAANQVEL